MIINIPINFDDTAIENKVAKNADKIIDEEIKSRINKVLEERDYSYYGNALKGLENYIASVIRGYITDEYKDEIIEKTSDKLAANLARTKKVKELKKND